MSCGSPILSVILWNLAVPTPPDAVGALLGPLVRNAVAGLAWEGVDVRAVLLPAVVTALARGPAVTVAAAAAGGPTRPLSQQDQNRQADWRRRRRG